MEAACEQMMTYAIGQDHELLKMAAKVGTTNLRDTWKAMHKDTRTALTPELAALKAMAQAADEANQVVV